MSFRSIFYLLLGFWNIIEKPRNPRSLNVDSIKICGTENHEDNNDFYVQIFGKFQGCIKFLPPCERVYQVYREEYQVLMMGKGTEILGKKIKIKKWGLGRISCEKRKKGTNIIFLIISRLLGRISNGEEWKGDGNFWAENRDSKRMGVRKNIKLKGTLYTPGKFSNQGRSNDV